MKINETLNPLDSRVQFDCSAQTIVDFLPESSLSQRSKSFFETKHAQSIQSEWMYPTFTYLHRDVTSVPLCQFFL